MPHVFFAVILWASWENGPCLWFVTRNWESDGSTFGVTVNNVLPGYTKTDRMEYLIEASSIQQQISKEEVEEKWRQSVPMKRMAEPQEVAEGIAFLASPAASYITGINLPVDGGRTPSL